jgi:hypothetical protein
LDKLQKDKCSAINFNGTCDALWMFAIKMPQKNPIVIPENGYGKHLERIVMIQNQFNMTAHHHNHFESISCFSRDGQCSPTYASNQESTAS